MDNKKQKAISGQMMKSLFLFIGFLTVVSSAQAWGVHDKITQAALAVVPDGDKVLGAENFRAMSQYSILPDLPFQREAADLGDFYADDYLLFRTRPEYWSKHSADHSMPLVRDLWMPHFERALQALRTETPVNASRQIAVLLHFVQDTGAPPHAYEPQPCPFHPELEGWFSHDQIQIKGYNPILLGQTDQEASQRFVGRMEALAAYSRERAKRALPFMDSKPPQRSKVEPIILESALESARVTADVLHTLFELRPRADKGASLTGVVTSAILPLRNEHGARMVLLDAEGSATPFSTMATSSGQQPDDAGWSGHYSFCNLPEGVYRVLACRTASSPSISDPVRLKRGEAVTLNINLNATIPTGNMIENPDGFVSTLQPDVPDRWRRKNNAWMSSFIWVKPGMSYRCGAVVKDPAVKVRFTFCGKPDRNNKVSPYTVIDLVPGKGNREQTITLDHERCKAYVEVISPRPFTEAVENVWLVPDGEGVDGKSFRIATFNLSRAGRTGIHAWSNRVDLVRDFIQRRKLDVLAVQEAMPEQIADLSTEEWAYVGVARKEDKCEGEACCIFYKKARFEVCDTGTFWLSETPEIPGSKSWDAAWPRICTWARLVDRKSRQSFFVFNTHLDNMSALARKKGIELIIKRLRTITPHYPVLLTGDMNLRTQSEPIRLIRTVLRDSYSVSKTPHSGPNATYNGYELNYNHNLSFDYIFVSEGIQVLTHATFDDSRDGRFPSDHFPVAADVIIDPKIAEGVNP